MTQDGNNGFGNGSVVNEQAVAHILQEEASCGYIPVMPLEALWASGTDSPQITVRRDIEFMQMHPVVSMALDYYKSGIAGAQFWGGPDQGNPDNDKGKPISPDPRVSAFVLAHAERFWQRGVPGLQEGYGYGWAPGEHIYKEVNGVLVWSHLKYFHPNDGFVLTYEHRPVGIRIKGIRDVRPDSNSLPAGNDLTPKDMGDYGDGDDDVLRRDGNTIDLWFASERIPAKAAWYAHRPRFGQLYGRSQLTCAWRPWRRLGWRDAVEQVIDAAVYRAGYKGPVVRHPQEDMQTALTGVPATRADGAGNMRRSARDAARQLVEWAKAGAGFTLSSAKYPQAQGGGNKWDIEWPDHVMDVGPLIKVAEYLEDQIMLGIGVPPELVRAGGTGSGYSGRSIPREAFLDGQQRIADAMLQMYVEQVIRPLVLWNFGDIPFDIQCKSLLKTQADDKQGEEQGKDGKQGGGGGGVAPKEASTPPAQQPPQPPPQPAPAQPQQSPMLSLEERSAEIVRRRTSPVEGRAMDIVRRWQARRAA